MTEPALAIVDDNLDLSEEISLFMQNANFFRDIRKFGDVLSLTTLSKQIDFKPTVVLLDVQLPYINGIDGIREILYKFPETNILVFTFYENAEHIVKAIKAGADGYILKGSSMQEILDALKIVSQGGAFVPPNIARKMFDYIRPGNLFKRKKTFSYREQQIIDALNEGKSYLQIANEIEISLDSVRTYVKRVYRKMEIKSKSELIYKIQNLFNKDSF